MPDKSDDIEELKAIVLDREFRAASFEAGLRAALGKAIDAFCARYPMVSREKAGRFLLKQMEVDIVKNGAPPISQKDKPLVSLVPRLSTGEIKAMPEDLSFLAIVKRVEKRGAVPRWMDDPILEAINNVEPNP